jgi:hypothetical protein
MWQCLFCAVQHTGVEVGILNGAFLYVWSWNKLGNVLERYNCVLLCGLKWRTGIMEGYGLRVLMVVFGFEGRFRGQCLEGGLNCLMMCLFTVHRILRLIRGYGGLAYMSGGKIYGKRCLWMSKGRACVEEEAVSGNGTWKCTLLVYRVCLSALDTCGLG